MERYLAPFHTTAGGPLGPALDPPTTSFLSPSLNFPAAGFDDRDPTTRESIVSSGGATRLTSMPEKEPSAAASPPQPYGFTSSSPSASVGGPTPTPSVSPESSGHPHLSAATAHAGTPVSFTLEDRMLLRLVYVQQKALQGQLETLLAATLSASLGAALGPSIPSPTTFSTSSVAAAAALSTPAAPLFHVPVGFSGHGSTAGAGLTTCAASSSLPPPTLATPACGGGSCRSAASSPSPRDPERGISPENAVRVTQEPVRSSSSAPSPQVMCSNASPQGRGKGEGGQPTTKNIEEEQAMVNRQTEAVETQNGGLTQETGRREGEDVPIRPSHHGYVLPTTEETTATAGPRESPPYHHHSRSSSRSASSLLDWGESGGNPLLSGGVGGRAEGGGGGGIHLVSLKHQEKLPQRSTASDHDTMSSTHSRHSSATCASTSSTTYYSQHDPVLFHRPPSTRSHSHSHSRSHSSSSSSSGGARHVDPSTGVTQTLGLRPLEDVTPPFPSPASSCRPATSLPSQRVEKEQLEGRGGGASRRGGGGGDATEGKEIGEEQGFLSEAIPKRTAVTPRITPARREEEFLPRLQREEEEEEEEEGEGERNGGRDDKKKRHLHCRLTQHSSSGYLDVRPPCGRHAHARDQHRGDQMEQKYSESGRPRRKTVGVKSTNWSGIDCLSDMSFDTQEYLRTNGLQV